MTVLVTGANGFIGRRCVNILVNRNHNVVATDLSTEKIPIGERIKAIKCDLSESVLDIMNTYKPSHVIHLAALLVSECESDPLQAVKVNVDTTAAILSEARKTGSRVTIASSIAVYGEQEKYGIDHRVNENDLAMPATMYGCTKLFCESIAAAYFRNHNLQVACLRLPIVFGPGRGTGISAWSANAVSWSAKQKQYSIPFSPSQRCALTYVDIAASCFCDVTLTQQGTNRLIYNLPGWSISLDAFVLAIESVIGSSGLIKFEGGGVMPFATEWNSQAYLSEFKTVVPSLENCIAAQVADERKELEVKS